MLTDKDSGVGLSGHLRAQSRAARTPGRATPRPRPPLPEGWERGPGCGPTWGVAGPSAQGAGARGAANSAPSGCGLCSAPGARVCRPHSGAGARGPHRRRRAGPRPPPAATPWSAQRRLALPAAPGAGAGGQARPPHLPPLPPFRPPAPHLCPAWLRPHPAAHLQVAQGPRSRRRWRRRRQVERRQVAEGEGALQGAARG